MNKRASVAFLLCLCGGLGAAAHADVIWRESVNGDFSNNGLSPTALSLALGDNSIIGVTGDPGTGVDRDYFSINVPLGYVLRHVILLDNTTISGGASFIGMQAGPQMTVQPTGAGSENLMGFAHYDPSMANTDLLRFLAPSLATSGVPNGTYSFWVQELGGPVDYGFDFVVEQSPVPIPGAGFLLMSGAIGLALLGRRGRLLSSS